MDIDSVMCGTPVEAQTLKSVPFVIYNDWFFIDVFNACSSNSIFLFEVEHSALGVGTRSKFLSYRLGCRDGGVVVFL